MVGGYLDPYVENVTDRAAMLGNRNLTENLLPSIQDTFIGAGHDGTSSRAAEAIGRAIRDTQEGITSQQLAALSGGYNSSIGAAQTDLSRLGQLGQTAGGLRTSDITSGVNVGGALSALGSETQRLGLQGAGALAGVGQQQQQLGQQNLDIGYQDFLRQQGYDQTQIDAMTKTVGALAPAVPKTILEQGYKPITDGNSSPSTAQTVANLAGAWLLGR